ncbi:hypothetical protein Aspvir_007005 [Aspergillus viridinutans]|uniref:Uncharacterized protein n=1 Tax=Aspergillus viridinutans TaxID=75553 RepID=A0A9P3BVB3_ASPVI|nr:uncharacterized protein Aspvir_007005 [Aspergillus viridinutans]GIK02940.1 hypothetical protein Aspvir_007005 [Aspergillus viridinutans]
MKVPYFLVFLAATASAKNVVVTKPVDGETLKAGNTVTVQIQRPGPFDPKQHESDQPPYQDFSVHIPQVLDGTAQLNFIYLAYVGPSSAPFMDTLERTVNIIPYKEISV